MPENEMNHVLRVMDELSVNTVVVSDVDSQQERIYKGGRLVYEGSGGMEAAEYWWDQEHVVCNLNGDVTWECSSYDGSPLPEDIIEDDDSI